jgi:hypothetical protein
VRIRKNKSKDKEEPKAKPDSKSESFTLLIVAVKGLLALAAIGGVLAGIIWLGQRAGEKVADQPRYTVFFATIRCPAPPGSDRLAFLTEVRYLSSWPETLQTVEPNLQQKLTEGFRKHPWVKSVEEVKIAPDATIEVSLTFRAPVLAVRIASDDELRAVDKLGVLLPPVPRPQDLPQLVNKMLAPTKPAGEIWDDPTIRRAAELIELYKPQNPSQIEKTPKGWRLTLEGGRNVVVSL